MLDFHWSSNSKYAYLTKYQPGKLSQQWVFNGDGLAPLGTGNSKKDWLRLDLFWGSKRVGVWWGHNGSNQKWDQVKGMCKLVATGFLKIKLINFAEYYSIKHASGKVVQVTSETSVQLADSQDGMDNQMWIGDFILMNKAYPGKVIINVLHTILLFNPKLLCE